MNGQIQFLSQNQIFFFSSSRRHTRLQGDWSSDVWSSDLAEAVAVWAPSQQREMIRGGQGQREPRAIGIIKEAAARQQRQRRMRHAFTVPSDLSAVGPPPADEDLEEACLPCPGASHEHRDLPRNGIYIRRLENGAAA